MASNAERWKTLLVLARIKIAAHDCCWRTLCSGEAEVQLLSHIAETSVYWSFLCNSV